MTTDNASDPDDLGEALSKNVLFVSVTVHLWRGQRKIDEADVTLGQANLAADLRTDPRWKLLPAVWASNFSGVESKIRRLVDIYTPKNAPGSSMPLRGIDIIPRKSAKAFFTELKALEDGQFKPLVDEFCTQWPTIVQELEKRFKDEKKEALWSEVAKHLPSSPNAVRSKFRIEKRVIPISFDTKIAVLDGEAAEEFADEVQQGVDEFKREAAMAIVAGLQAELNAAVDNLADRIMEKGIVKGGTIDMVRIAFDKMQAFQFAATPEVKAKMAAVKLQLDGLDHTQLNHDLRHETGEIANKLAQSLKALRQQTAEDAKNMKKFGKQARTLEL